MNRKRLNEIIAKVNAILDALRELQGAELSLPIDPSEIARARGLKIEKVERFPSGREIDPSVSTDVRTQGFLRGDTVFVSRDQSPGAARFTVAHELAHRLLHPEPLHHREYAIGRHGSQPQEVEADFFASRLLMPEPLVRSEFGARFGRGLDLTIPSDDLAYDLTMGTRRKVTASQLARMPQLDRAILIARTAFFAGAYFTPICDVFGVSAEAMARRLLELGLVS